MPAARTRTGDGYILRSDDGGETWSDPIPVLDDLVVDIAIDPSQPSTVYVSQGDEQDRREPRRRRDVDASLGSRSQLSNSLAVDPRRSGTIHVAALRGVYTSTDYGITWAFHPFSPSPSGASVSSLLVDPLDSDILYVGTYDAGLFRSIDGGITWGAAGAELAYDTVSTLTADADTGTVYVGTGRGLFRSRNAGADLEPTGAHCAHGRFVRAIGHDALRGVPRCRRRRAATTAVRPGSAPRPASAPRRCRSPAAPTARSTRDRTASSAAPTTDGAGRSRPPDCATAS